MVKEDLPGSLIYVNDTMAGLFRCGKEGNFYYTNKLGERIRDEMILSRIKELVIPPDWKDVWICKSRNGHIQVTGRDSKGRKQYIYHRLWHEKISTRKFDNLLKLGESLPEIRKQLKKDLRRRNWDKRKVTALAIKLMEELYLRVGNKMYQKENGTYGLTTLRRKHLIEDKNNLILKFKAKSGKLMKVKISHPTLKKQLRQCSELPGYELFRYQIEDKYLPIDSQDINEYLRDISGSSITSKDFRTWGGTVLTIKFEPVAKAICTENPRKKMEPTLVRLVADELNNTVTVCRKYYIHPEVLKVAVGDKIAGFQPKEGEFDPKIYNHAEQVVMKILADETSIVCRT
jgi:DNA topoisomerase I